MYTIQLDSGCIMNYPTLVHGASGGAPCECGVSQV